VLAEHELITSEFVLDELERVLTERFGVPENNIHAIIALLRRFHVEPVSEDLPELVLRDPDDLYILAAALASNADVLVTGDRDLLDVKGQAGITITDPRGFWNMLKERHHQ
jgi:putative PIN family toxin of toxin-antitoxin system